MSTILHESLHCTDFSLPILVIYYWSAYSEQKILPITNYSFILFMSSEN